MNNTAHRIPVYWLDNVFSLNYGLNYFIIIPNKLIITLHHSTPNIRHYEIISSKMKNESDQLLCLPTALCITVYPNNCLWLVSMLKCTIIHISTIFSYQYQILSVYIYIYCSVHLYCNILNIYTYIRVLCKSIFHRCIYII